MKIQKIRDVKTPTRAHQDDAGIDFYIPDDAPWESFTIVPGGSLLIPSGIKAAVPKGFGLVAMEKSGVATKLGLIAGAKLVDSGYQGEMHIHLMNPTNKPATVVRGQKIIQFALVAVSLEEVDLVENLFDGVSSRGVGGFGSTGV